jgi:hypothetical protein
VVGSEEAGPALAPPLHLFRSLSQLVDGACTTGSDEVARGNCPEATKSGRCAGTSHRVWMQISDNGAMSAQVGLVDGQRGQRWRVRWTWGPFDSQHHTAAVVPLDAQGQGHARQAIGNVTHDGAFAAVDLVAPTGAKCHSIRATPPLYYGS